MVELTQKELKKILHYDPDTGIFTRLTDVVHNAAAGNIAGHLSIIGYIQITLSYKRYYAHRLAWLYMTGCWPKHQIDHINHARDDNRFCNLREVNHADNQKNRTMYKVNKSGVVGVCWNKREKKWRARIVLSKKEKFLGCFVDKFEAICARKSAEFKYGFHENHGASYV